MAKKQRKSSSATERLDMGGASWEDALTTMSRAKLPVGGIPPRKTAKKSKKKSK
jgi:hypothetical protein